MLTSNEMSLKQGDDAINNEGKVAELLNNICINVMENISGKKPLRVLDNDNVTFSKAVNAILEEYKYDPTILEDTLNKRKIFLFLN